MDDGQTLIPWRLRWSQSSRTEHNQNLKWSQNTSIYLTLNVHLVHTDPMNLRMSRLVSYILRKVHTVTFKKHGMLMLTLYKCLTPEKKYTDEPPNSHSIINHSRDNWLFFFVVVVVVVLFSFVFYHNLNCFLFILYCI